MNGIHKPCKQHGPNVTLRSTDDIKAIGDNHQTGHNFHWTQTTTIQPHFSAISTRYDFADILVYSTSEAQLKLPSNKKHVLFLSFFSFIHFRSVSVIPGRVWHPVRSFGDNLIDKEKTWGFRCHSSAPQLDSFRLIDSLEPVTRLNPTKTNYLVMIASCLVSVSQSFKQTEHSINKATD